MKTPLHTNSLWTVTLVLYSFTSDGRSLFRNDHSPLTSPVPVPVPGPVPGSLSGPVAAPLPVGSCPPAASAQPAALPSSSQSGCGRTAQIQIWVDWYSVGYTGRGWKHLRKCAQCKERAECQCCSNQQGKRSMTKYQLHCFNLTKEQYQLLNCN